MLPFERACRGRRFDASLLSFHGTRGLVPWSGLTPGSEPAGNDLSGKNLWFYAMAPLDSGSISPTECESGAVSSSKPAPYSTIEVSEVFPVQILPGSVIFAVHTETCDSLKRYRTLAVQVLLRRGSGARDNPTGPTSACVGLTDGFHTQSQRILHDEPGRSSSGVLALRRPDCLRQIRQVIKAPTTNARVPWPDSFHRKCL